MLNKCKEHCYHEPDLHNSLSYYFTIKFILNKFSIIIKQLRNQYDTLFKDVNIKASMKVIYYGKIAFKGHSQKKLL